VKYAARMLGSHVSRGYCGTGVKSRTRSHESRVNFNRRKLAAHLNLRWN